MLRRAGLVHARREGAWVHYRLSDVAETWLAPPLSVWRADPGLLAECRALLGCR